MFVRHDDQFKAAREEYAALLRLEGLTCKAIGDHFGLSRNMGWALSRKGLRTMARKLHRTSHKLKFYVTTP